MLANIMGKIRCIGWLFFFIGNNCTFTVKCLQFYSPALEIFFFMSTELIWCILLPFSDLLSLSHIQAQFKAQFRIFIFLYITENIKIIHFKWTKLSIKIPIVSHKLTQLLSCTSADSGQQKTQPCFCQVKAVLKCPGLQSFHTLSELSGSFYSFFLIRMDLTSIELLSREFAMYFPYSICINDRLAWFHSTVW